MAAAATLASAGCPEWLEVDDPLPDAVLEAGPPRPPGAMPTEPAAPGAPVRLTTVLVRSNTIAPVTPPKWANARRWQSQNVARSMLVVYATNGSREYDRIMWKE